MATKNPGQALDFTTSLCVSNRISELSGLQGTCVEQGELGLDNQHAMPFTVDASLGSSRGNIKVSSKRSRSITVQLVPDGCLPL
jgi:hypothetical protein